MMLEPHPRCMRTNGLLIFLATLILAYQADAQCRLISNKYGSVYITFERVGTIPVNEEHRAGMIFRFRNNSTCAVTISIEGSLDEPASYGNEQLDALAHYWLSRPATIYGGSSEIQRNIVAKAVLDLPG